MTRRSLLRSFRRSCIVLAFGVGYRPVEVDAVVVVVVFVVEFLVVVVAVAVFVVEYHLVVVVAVIETVAVVAVVVETIEVVVEVVAVVVETIEVVVEVVQSGFGFLGAWVRPADRRIR